MEIETSREQFLGFWLTSSLQAVISTESVSEVLSIESSNIIPLPDIAYTVMGIYNHRGSILWVIDLPCLMGLKPLYISGYRHHFSVLLMRSHQQIMGFGVPKVGQIISSNQSRTQFSFSKQKTQQLDWCMQGTCSTTDKIPKIILDREKIFDLLKL